MQVLSPGLKEVSTTSTISTSQYWILKSQSYVLKVEGLGRRGRGVKSKTCLQTGQSEMSESSMLI